MQDCYKVLLDLHSQRVAKGIISSAIKVSRDG